MNYPSLGRITLVQNLIQHLLKGTWAVVSGGPKLGKTTLLQQVGGTLLANNQLVYLDLGRSPVPDLSESMPKGEKPVIFLIDNCDALLSDATAFIQHAHDLIQKKRGSMRSIVLAGSVEWGEWVMAHRQEIHHPIRYYPLGVLPPKEARPIVLGNLFPGASSAEAQRVLDLSGGHPYLLKGLLEDQHPYFDDFFLTLWNTVRSDPERALLTHFISADTWVRLEDLKGMRGKKVPKILLDRLANLGLIIRTLVDGAAAARIVSSLFSEWARRSFPMPD
jgi:hypothetical protein